MVSTLAQGTNFSSTAKLPNYSRVTTTIISNQAKVLALTQETPSLPAKGANKPLDTLRLPTGFYSPYSLVWKNTGLSWTRGVYSFLKGGCPLRVVPVRRLAGRFLQCSHCAIIGGSSILPSMAGIFSSVCFHSGFPLAPRVFTRCISTALSPSQSQGMKILP